MICNHIGVERSLDALQWSGRGAFTQATPGVWLGPNSHPVGYARHSGPLTLLLVMGSGHMVPLDKPAEALDMLKRFIDGRSFEDSSSNTIKGSPLPRERSLLSLVNGTRALRGGNEFYDAAEAEAETEALLLLSDPAGSPISSLTTSASSLGALALSFIAGAAITVAITKKWPPAGGAAAAGGGSSSDFEKREEVREW